MIHETVSKAPPVANPVVVHQHVLAGRDAPQLVVLDSQDNVAAHGTHWADTVRIAEFPYPCLKAKDAAGEGANGTDVDGVALPLAGQRATWAGAEASFGSPPKEIQLVIIGPLIQEADAAPAEYASLLVYHDQLAQRITFVLMTFILDIAALAWSVLEGLILEGAFPPLIAYRAI